VEGRRVDPAEIGEVVAASAGILALSTPGLDATAEPIAVLGCAMVRPVSRRFSSAEVGCVMPPYSGARPALHVHRSVQVHVQNSTC